MYVTELFIPYWNELNLWLRSVIKKIGIFNQLVTIVKFVLEKPGKWF